MENAVFQYISCAYTFEDVFKETVSSYGVTTRVDITTRVYLCVDRRPMPPSLSRAVRVPLGSTQQHSDESDDEGKICL